MCLYIYIYIYIYIDVFVFTVHVAAVHLMINFSFGLHYCDEGICQ